MIELTYKGSITQSRTNELKLKMHCSSFMGEKMACCEKEDFETIKEYDPMPKNRDGSIRWFLFRWDDGKDGARRLVRCKLCGAFYLVQSYHLHRFSELRETLFEDFYSVKDEREADSVNRTYTGVRLEQSRKPDFQLQHKK